MRNVNYNRHRRSLQGKATSYILVVVLFFSFDATAQQRLGGFSPNIHRKTSLRCYLFQWWYLEIMGAQNDHFWSENSHSAIFGVGRPLRGNEQEF